MSTIDKSIGSLCSIRAAKRGAHQRVIGVSAYMSRWDNRKLLPKLWTYLLEYIQEAQQAYPDWIVRVYHFSLNISNEMITQIENKYSNVDFCNSNSIPLLGNIVPWLPGKMQRFLPIADPLVDAYMSRDIDSPILDRELAAVQQWLQSDKIIHILRDHPEHSVPILGGLWGVNLSKHRAWIRDISQRLLSSDIAQCYPGTRDQEFLNDFLWPYAETHRRLTLEHDSFLCRRFRNAVAFPTRKTLPTHFLGCRRPKCDTDAHPPCPKMCRPANHSDWIWC